MFITGSPKAVPTPPPFFQRTMSLLCPRNPILFLLIYPFDLFPILKIRNLQTFLYTKVTGNEPAHYQSEVPHNVDCPQRSRVLSLSIDNLISKFHSAYDAPTAQQQDPHDYSFSSAIAFPSIHQISIQWQHTTQIHCLKFLAANVSTCGTGWKVRNHPRLG